MRRLRNYLSISLSAAVVFSTGCASFKLKDPPAGFAEVESWSGYARMKSGDDVGINISSFHNVDGGTLAFWSEDMVEKLGRRSYRLQRQTPVTSKNGVTGTRFDFSYDPPTAENEHKFYTAILFVSDKHRVVVQFAGEADLIDKYSSQADRVAKDIKIRGCRGRDICRGPQPGKLETTAPAAVAVDPEDTPEPADAPAPEPEPAPADTPEPAGTPEPAPSEK